MAVGEGGGTGGGPDWPVVGAGIATVLTVLGGIIAGMRGSFKGKTDDEHERRRERDTAATANASLTLESVFRLVNELQEEVVRKSTEIVRIERSCQETKDALLIRIAELESAIRKLEAEVRDLKAK